MTRLKNQGLKQTQKPFYSVVPFDEDDLNILKKIILTPSLLAYEINLAENKMIVGYKNLIEKEVDSTHSIFYEALYMVDELGQDNLAEIIEETQKKQLDITGRILGSYLLSAVNEEKVNVEYFHAWVEVAIS